MYIFIHNNKIKNPSFKLINDGFIKINNIIKQLKLYNLPNVSLKNLIIVLQMILIIANPKTP